MKKALITGHDGAYLAEFLLKKDIRCMASNAVHRCFRQRRTGNTDQIDHLYQNPHGENR